MSEPVETVGFNTALNFSGRGRNLIGADGYGGQSVSQQLPSLAWLLANGRIYSITTAAGTAKAPVGTMGTTTAAFAFWNSNAASTKYCQVILEVAAHLVSGTSPVGATAMIAVSPTAQGSAVSPYAGVVGPICQSGPSTRVSNVIIGGAITLAGAPVWRSVASSSVALAVGGAMLAKGEGGLALIRPQYAMGMTVQSDAGTTPLWGWTVTYAEVELDAV